jgi:thiol:disulfide interchange protein DsbD
MKNGDDFIAVKVDLTKSGNPVQEKLLQRYAIKGVPSVVFLAPEGNERQELRVLDCLSINHFLTRMTEARKGQSL